MFLQNIIIFSFLSLALACSNNNCLNALRHAGANARTFCATYTHGISTATTALPTYATQCSNLPSKISSACTCLVTSTTSAKPSTTLSTIVSTATEATCTPSLLHDTDFSAELSTNPTTLQSWQVSVNKVPGTTILPLTGFMAASTNFFKAEFSNSASDPYLTTVTLSQGGVQVCDGTGQITYQYVATINAIAANPVPQNNNCTITSGLTGIPASVFVNSVDWVTGFPFPTMAYGFPISGLGSSGLSTSFYITIECTLVDWWPRIEIMTPMFQTL